MSLERYSRNLRPCLKELRPYVAGKSYGEISRRFGLRQEDIVKLGSNENPYGPSPKVAEALKLAVPERYPEPEEFIEALARYTGSPKERIVIGSGMDGVMETLTKLFLGPGDKSLIYTPTFSYYEILTTLCGATPVFCQRNDEFEIEGQVPEDVKLTFICSPNNPTGNVTSEEALRSVVEATDSIVFLDEAYVDFAEKSLASLVGEYQNLVVGRTMSKAFGLAGMRLGYAVMPEWIAEQYRRAAPPFFGVTSPSVAAGVAALEDLDHMRQSVDAIRSQREKLSHALGEKIHPSQGNFIYLKTEDNSSVVAEKMLSHGVIIRDCRPFRGAGENHVRVTVGTPEQNCRFLEAYWEIDE
jgi:histidinol-phosphate aminotransferase